MKPSVAPTSRMIAISRLRCSTAMRIVVPMMITATTANAAPDHEPDGGRDLTQAVELLHPIAPEPHVVDEPEPLEPLGDVVHVLGVRGIRA